MEDVEAIIREVIDCGYQIHRDLGPGLLESAYEILMTAGVRASGLQVATQVPVRMSYRGITVENAFRVDMLVEGRLVIELKSVERTSPVHAKQVLTYLRVMDLPLGLLINFGLPTYREGIKRIANGYDEPRQAR